jgi:hypothetical protein
VTKGERIEKALTDLRTIASVSVLHNHLPLAAECLQCAIAVQHLGNLARDLGLDGSAFQEASPPPGLATKGATLKALEDDLRTMSLAFIADGEDRTAVVCVRCATAIQNLVMAAEAEGVAGNLMMLATLTAERPTA